MEELRDDIRKYIDATVHIAIEKIKDENLLKSNRKGAFGKTEELLKMYPDLKKVKGEHVTRKTVEMIEEAIEEIKNDIYFDVIPLYYFENMTRYNIADRYNTTVRTITRNKRRLVQQLSLRLASDEVIQELLQ